MTWLRKNPLFGAVLIAIGALLIAAAALFYTAQSAWGDASARYATDADELMRLQRLTPFPTGENVRKMKAHAEEYGTALGKLKEELKLRVLPTMPLAPSEFQTRLRVAIAAATERARLSKVKMPARFFFGFDEFATALPQTQDAPLLGQELAQAELLTNIIIDARVDALTAFRRIARSEAPASPTPAQTARAASVTGAPQLVARNVIETTFVSSPGASRRVLNQITAAEKQFYIIRLLQVRNEKDKGPPRESGPEPPAAASAATPTPGGAPLKFIVGSEHIETSTRVELVRFNL